MSRNLLAVPAVLMLVACSPAAAPPGARAESAEAAPAPIAGDAVEGLRVATRVGCRGCHGDDGGGRKLWAEEGKFQLYSANLTVKRELYDAAGLDALLRQGRSHDGHVPFGMPVFMLQHLSDREVRDIDAWLRGLPAVANPDLPVSWFAPELREQIESGTHPYSQDMRPDPGNRPPPLPPAGGVDLGRHLAMTTCAECHGPDLNGFPGDNAPPLIVAKAYTPEQFARLMRTGITASGGRSASGLMSGVAVDRFSVMRDDEIAALKAFLDSR